MIMNRRIEPDRERVEFLIWTEFIGSQLERIAIQQKIQNTTGSYLVFTGQNSLKNIPWKGETIGLKFVYEFS